MEWEVTPSADLQRMKEEMNRAWESFIKKNAIAEEREIWQWAEKFPKFEGTKRTSKSRSRKAIKPY